MATKALVTAMLAFENEMVRTAIITAYLYENDQDRDMWRSLLPGVFDESGEQFVPIPLSTVLAKVDEVQGQWEALERDLGLPIISPWDAEDGNIDANFRLDVIPITTEFLDCILEDNGSDGINAASIVPGYTCSIYDQPYIILDTIRDPNEIDADGGPGKLRGLLCAPACLIDASA